MSGAPAMGFHENSANGTQDAANGNIPRHGKFPFLLNVFKENIPAFMEYA